MDIPKVAVILLVNDKRKILLYLRDNNPNIPYPNTWAMLGGHLETGEGVLDALKREISEEIGIKIKNPIFINKFNDGVGNEVFVYRENINAEIDDLRLSEGQYLKYFDFNGLLKLNNVPKPLKKFLKENKNVILG